MVIMGKMQIYRVSTELMPLLDKKIQDKILNNGGENIYWREMENAEPHFSVIKKMVIMGMQQYMVW